MSDRNALECPSCRGRLDKVRDSRPAQFHGQKIIRRRRVCTDCGERHNTFEVLEPSHDDLRREIGKALIRKLVDDVL